jgi:alpha-N-acetylglucosamine transferase
MPTSRGAVTRFGRLFCSDVRLLIAVAIALIIITSSYSSGGAIPIPRRQGLRPIRTQSNRSKFAFATFLSTRVQNETEDDPYFTAARVLAYQLLHHPTTRTKNNIPLLVLTPSHVSQHKKDVLSREGAIIIPVEPVKPKNDWLVPFRDNWVDQFSKLRLLQLTDYDRILYMDNDMLLTKCLDDIFHEPVVQEMQNIKDIKSEIKEDEGGLPSTYLFVGVSDTGGSKHPTPAIERDELNGGFWLVRPDTALFAYYLRILEIPSRFDSSFMEQGLLNYAHRREGNMPWRAFEAGRWNVNWPSSKDAAYGTATLHDKFWDPANEEWIDRKLVEMWWRMQGAMEGYWLRDAER